MVGVTETDRRPQGENEEQAGERGHGPRGDADAWNGEKQRDGAQLDGEQRAEEQPPPQPWMGQHRGVVRAITIRSKGSSKTMGAAKAAITAPSSRLQPLPRPATSNTTNVAAADESVTGRMGLDGATNSG